MTLTKYGPIEKLGAPLLPPELAAGYMALSVATLAEWRCKGIGPKYVRCGRVIRYEIAALEAFKVANTFSSTSEASARLAG